MGKHKIPRSAHHHGHIGAVKSTQLIARGDRQRRSLLEVNGEGYYTADCCVSVAPTAAGPVTVALYNNGVQIPGAIAYGAVSTAGDSVTLPIITTIRQGCCCDSADNLTCVLIEGAGTVRNVSLRVEKA